MTPQEIYSAQRILHRISDSIGSVDDAFESDEFNQPKVAAQMVAALLAGIRGEFESSKSRKDFVAVCMSAASAFVHMAAKAGGDIGPDGGVTAEDRS